MMMHKATLLMLCCLTVPTSCATLYPGLRFDQRALASFLLSSSAMLPNQLPHAEDKTKQAADHRVAEARDNVKRQSGICKDTYKQDLTAILNEQKIRRWQQDVTRHRLAAECHVTISARISGSQPQSKLTYQALRPVTNRIPPSLVVSAAAGVLVSGVRRRFLLLGDGEVEPATLIIDHTAAVSFHFSTIRAF
nr:somatoliberin isoform X2 [Paramormyrops kingsleyae]